MSGPLYLVGGTATQTLPVLTRPYRPAPQDAEAALDWLAERMSEVCAAAVHPDEIAAVLESDGLTEEQIRQRYGSAGLFELAQELYERVPRSHLPADPVPDPWRTDPWRCVLRGVVFALPGLGYLLGARLFTAGPRETAALAASALFAWAWNQALAHRAYLWLGLGNKRAMTGVLMAGAPVGTAVASGIAFCLSGPGPVAVFAAGQAVYLGAATVLLVLARERLLLLSLAPTAAAALIPGAPGTALLVATVVGTVVAAAWAATGVRRAEPAAARGARPRRRGEVPGLVRSLPFAFFGLGSGTLMLMSSVDAYAIAALALSMGAAEWLLYRYRGLGLAALQRCRTPGSFQVRAGAVLVVCLAGYLAVVGTLAMISAALWPGGTSPEVARSLTGVVALGALLWTALLLQAFGIAWPPALVCLAAVGAEASGPLYTGHPAMTRVVAAGASAAVLLVLAYVRLGRATAHR